MTSREPSSDIERTAAGVLRPVLRLLVDSGLSRQALERWVDVAYIEAAMKRLGRDVAVASIEALSAESGVPIARVRELLEIIEKDYKVRAAAVGAHAPLVAATERVLSAWYTDEQFTDESGQPRPLSIEDPAFATLVERFGNSRKQTEIADYLLSTRSVVINDVAELVPQGRHVLALPRSEEMTHNSLEALTDLAHAIAVNQEKQLTGPGPLQRTCVNERMPTRIAPLFRAMIRETTQAYLESIDDWLVQHEAGHDDAAETPTVRLGVGVYVVAEE